ncbi:uncharacterized protein LOC108145013 [Drosophila elegans]|uniref:uncharacterized protein LOC108145013 n=1 Tax=Drosophila elegans TaxID=30023 RepID=UPI0007E663AA|nr:uncharacterized protein LOC108145013 [Drosophila elegans]
MKTRQLPLTTRTTTTTTTASFRAKQRDVGDRLGGGMPCERELKHEAAKREREEQLKRERATAAVAAAARRVRQRMSADRDVVKRRTPLPRERQQAAAAAIGRAYQPSVASCVAAAAGSRVVGARTGKGPKKATLATITEEQLDQDRNKDQTRRKDQNNVYDAYDAKAEQLKNQLEELAALSEHEFEPKFRQWLDQEGIARELHSHLRVELIHCFNNTALGQLLSKAAGVQMAHSHSLLLSPLAMMLHTLVAEFLHSQNCHFTLSVFCSETQHRGKLPDFRSRPEFRFRPDELQQVLSDILGGKDAPPDPELGQLVADHYEEDLAGQTQCLLMALLRSLVEIRRSLPGSVQKEANTPPTGVSLRDSTSQTEPSACLEARPEVDTSGLYQTEEHELVLGADGRSVFVGARVSQSLHSVEQQLSQLLKNVRQLAKSCAPPVDVISSSRFEELLKREIRERERLTKAGQSFNPGETVTKLPPYDSNRDKPVAKKNSPVDDVVYTESGPIKLPVQEVEVPRLPRLHPEQLASLAIIRQSLEKVQRKASQPLGRMYVSVERMENLVSDVCGCVQLLGNVLNLSMEQEYAIGLHKGFDAGYREGFGHGHFMGLQEGRQKEKLERTKLEQPPPEKRECSVQVKIQRTSRSTQTPTKLTSKTNAPTQTDKKHIHNAWVQADLQTETPRKSYEQWIYEMLHSSSGQVFLERVELSLGKAMELQKERLDELYQVKLRHQAEMLRLSRRQNSWRSLCKRVERDSQSSVEARDLVQKIFRLLEHYESHHHQLAEKIQQTEIAAEQAARILPMWTEGSVKGTAPCNWNSAMSSSSTSTGICAPAPAQIEDEATAGVGDKPQVNKTQVNKSQLAEPQRDSSQLAHPYPGLGYPCQLLALAPTGGIPVAGTFLPVIPRLSGSLPQDSGRNLPHAITSTTNIAPTTVNRSVSNSKIRAGATDGYPIHSVTNAQADKVSISRHYTVSHDPLPPENNPRDPAVPIPRDSASNMLSVQPAEETTLAPGPTPADPPPPNFSKPSTHSVATNTMALQPLQLTPLKPSAKPSIQGPSFEEALLSAKNRMLQLEQESELLEQSFLNYLEKTKTSKPSAPKSTEDPPKSRRIRFANLRERDQMNSKLDNFQDWHRRVRKEDAVSLAQLEDLQHQRTIPGSVLDSKASSPLWLSELEEAHEQDSYPFTNAISEARTKLLGEIMPAGRAKEAKEAKKAKKAEQECLATGVPLTIPEVLNPSRPPALERLPIDIKPSRSGSNAEMSLLLRRAKGALGLRAPHPLLDTSSSSSSSSSSSREQPSPSSKLLQSMAKMQLLFGGGQPVKPAVIPIPTKRSTRPLSAPTHPGSGMVVDVGLSRRPHTAPTLHPISEKKEPPVLGLDISTSSSSSLSTLPGRSPGEAFQDLVTGAVVSGHHSQCSPKVSYSQDFWKRMNL